MPRVRSLAIAAGVLLGLFVLLLIAVASSWSVVLDLDRSLGHAIVGRPSWLVSPADSLGLSTRDISTGAVVVIAVALLWRPHRLWAIGDQPAVAVWLVMRGAGLDAPRRRAARRVK